MLIKETINPIGAIRRIRSICSDREECYLLDFLYELDERYSNDIDRLMSLFDTIAHDNEGPRLLPKEKSHEIGKEIWEFISGRLRIAWFYDQNKIIICSHGFVKKSQKTPKNEIKRAVSYKAKYFDAKSKGEIKILPL